MKKRVLSFILIIATLMSVSTVTFSKETDDGFDRYASILVSLDFLDADIYARGKADFVTYGEFADAISKIKNADCSVASEDYITVNDAADVAAYEFGYELFIGKDNADYVSYKRKVLTGVSSEYSEILTVENFVRILYNVINTPVLVKKQYGQIANFEVDANRTPLTEYHDVYFKRGRVTANSVTSIDKYAVTSNGFIRIGDSVYYDGGVYSDFIGHYVEFYYKADTDSSVNTVIGMEKTHADDDLIIPASDIESFENLTYNYYVNNKRKKIEIPVVHTVILNGQKLDVYERDVYVPQNGNVTLIKNKNGIYDIVVIESYVAFPLLYATAGGTDEIVFTSRYSNRILTVDTARNDCVFNLSIDGKPQKLEKFTWEHRGETKETITLPSFPKYSVANVFADKYKNAGGFMVPADDAKYIKIDITTKLVNGTVDAFSAGNDTITISGEEYYLSKQNNISQETGMPELGEKGIFMFDYDGEIVSWARDYYDNKVLEYAYLINADVQNGLGGKLVLKMLLSNGDIEVFTAKKNVVLNSDNEKDPKIVKSKLQNSAKLLNSSFNISQIIKFRTDENGEVCEIETVLQEVGLPENVDKGHINRVIPRTRYYSRSDNGYSLYKYVGEWPYTADYLKPELIFSVPTTETFEDDDYNICYTWAPDYSGKNIDIFDVNDYRQPKAVVAYEDDANSIFRPYVMVEEITVELDRNGEVVSLLRGYDGYDSMVFYSDELSMFNGFKEGDLVYVEGFGNKVTKKPKLVLSIEDVKKFDYKSIPKNAAEISMDCCLYELYSYAGRSLTLQRGEIDSEGKREFQKGAYWTTVVGSLKYGAIVYDADCREGSRISGSPDLELMRPAIDYGNNSASKMFVYENGGICRLVIIYNGL